MTELLTPLLARTQAFVVLAVGPAHWERVLGAPVPGRGTRLEGAIGGPYDAGPALVELPVEGAVPAPEARGLWIHDSVERAPRWLETEVRRPATDLPFA